MIDPKKQSRIAALNYLEHKLPSFSLLSEEEINKITKAMTMRLRYEDNSYILCKI